MFMWRSRHVLHRFIINPHQYHQLMVYITYTSLWKHHHVSREFMMYINCFHFLLKLIGEMPHNFLCIEIIKIIKIDMPVISPSMRNIIETQLKFILLKIFLINFIKDSFLHQSGNDRSSWVCSPSFNVAPVSSASFTIASLYTTILHPKMFSIKNRVEPNGSLTCSLFQFTNCPPFIGELTSPINNMKTLLVLRLFPL